MAYGTSINDDLGAGGLENVLVADANGNVVANVIPRTGTLAALQAITTAAGDPEIAVASTGEIVVYNGGVAKTHRRSKLVGKTTIQQATTTAAGAATAWNVVSFVGGVIVEDDLSAADLANSRILVPAGIDYYEVHYYVPWAEITSTSGSRRRARVTLGGSAVGLFVAGAPTTVTGEIGTTLSGFIPKSTKTLASSIGVQLETYHDSAAIPNLGIGTSLPTMTVLMYATA